MKKTLQNKHAFTIVELVIVIAVISILAAVLIPTFSSIVRKAKEVRLKSELAMKEKEQFANEMLSEKVPEETEKNVPAFQESDWHCLSQNNQGLITRQTMKDNGESVTVYFQYALTQEWMLKLRDVLDSHNDAIVECNSSFTYGSGGSRMVFEIPLEAFVYDKNNYVDYDENNNIIFRSQPVAITVPKIDLKEHADECKDMIIYDDVAYPAISFSLSVLPWEHLGFARFKYEYSIDDSGNIDIIPTEYQ